MFTLLCIVSLVLNIFVDGVSSSEDVSTSVSAKFIGSFSCNGGLTSGPGFLAIDGGALIVSRFTGDPLESDDVASVSDFAERIIAGTIVNSFM